MVERNMTTSLAFDRLSDAHLLEEIRKLLGVERQTVADFLRALIEVDSRRLYLGESCSSLFTYCTEVLHLEESAAYNRIEVARAARRVPALLDAVSAGSITLTSARLLAPHLTVENHTALLEAAKHRSKREVEILIASLVPRPPVATVIRRVPARKPVAETTSSASHPSAQVATSAALALPAPVPEAAPGTAGSGNAVVHRLGVQHSVVAPLSADTYKLQVTLSAKTHSKLQRARDLLRHAIPCGDIGEVLDRALTLLLQDVEKRRCAAVTTPREDAPRSGHTRHIPAAVKRQVWRRDEGRCAFSRAGRRCAETAFLEFHHVVPFADRGAATVANIELRCRAHNQYEAALLFSAGSEVVRETAERW